MVTVLQVYPEGIRHIRADKRVNEWKTPGKRAIGRCAINERQVGVASYWEGEGCLLSFDFVLPQVVIALSGGEIVYFEMDQVRVG